jgi:hypothetical protein
MSRLRTNWRVILVDPRPLVEVMESMPLIVENCRSRGVAIEEAIVSALAPGRLAFTLIVGKSTLGRSFTASCRYPITPKRRMAIMTRVVMMGRRIKSSVTLIGAFSR